MFTNRGASNRANKSHCVVIWSCWDAFNCCAAIWSRYWGAFHGCYIVWNVPFNSNTILLLKGVTRGIHDKGRLWYCYRQLQNGVEPLVIAGTSLNNRRKTMESYLIARTFVYFIFTKTMTLSKMFGTLLGDYGIIDDVQNFKFYFYLSWENMVHIKDPKLPNGVGFLLFFPTHNTYSFRDTSQLFYSVNCLEGSVYISAYQRLYSMTLGQILVYVRARPFRAISWVISHIRSIWS